MQTLVLDIGYQPHARVPWETAIVWVLERIVEVVDEYPDRYIRTPNWRVNMPSIVRLLKPIPRRRAVKFSRHGVYERDKGQCQYCSRKVSRSDFTYDHVTPRAQGGQTKWENVVVSCVPCNQRKGGRSPRQAGMVLRQTPIRPKTLASPRSPIVYSEGMPSAWRDYLRDAVYWDGELDGES